MEARLRPCPASTTVAQRARSLLPGETIGTNLRGGHAQCALTPISAVNAGLGGNWWEVLIVAGFQRVVATWRGKGLCGLKLA